MCCICVCKFFFYKVLGYHDSVVVLKFILFVHNHNGISFKLSGTFLIFMHMKNRITRNGGMELKLKL